MSSAAPSHDDVVDDASESDTSDRIGSRRTSILDAAARDAAARDADTVGLSRTADDRIVPSPRVRALLARVEENALIGWGLALILTGLGFLFRVIRLGEPKVFQFDETYYAKDAWSMLQNGYVRNYVDGADNRIINGDLSNLFKPDEVSMIVHPEVGKWLIAIGEKAFGMDPFGWRIASAVVGALMILVMARFVRRVTGSTLLGLLGALLLAFDGLQLVLSRLALLDIFLAFFLLCGVHCIVADRQWFRERLAAQPPPVAANGTVGWGPRLWLRPWLLGAGLMFGLAAGTKWTALYPLAAFGLLAWIWTAGARSSYGVSGAWLKSTLRDGIPAFFSLVGLAFVVYVLTWSSWLMHAGDYERALSNNQYTQYDGGKQWDTATEPDASGLGEVTQSLRSLAHYHRDVFVFHSHFLNDSEHTYMSKPSGWLLVQRPVGVHWEDNIQPGDRGCDAKPGAVCARQVLLLPNPILWWGACLALAFSVLMWVGSRDWRFGVAVVGTASTWLPWLQYDDRPIFLFYAICCLPFLVLALCLTAGKLIGPVDQPPRLAGIVVVGTFTVFVLMAFAFFWPIWTDLVITKDAWNSRIWFKSWI